MPPSRMTYKNDVRVRLKQLDQNSSPNEPLILRIAVDAAGFIFVSDASRMQDSIDVEEDSAKSAPPCFLQFQRASDDSSLIVRHFFIERAACELKFVRRFEIKGELLRRRF